MRSTPLKGIVAILSLSWLVCGLQLALAVEIPGKVARVTGQAVELSSDTELLPQAGDTVKIYIELKTFKTTALVTTGKVTGLVGHTILVRSDDPQAKPAPGHLAKIDSANPIKKSDVAASAPPTGMQPPGQLAGGALREVYRIGEGTNCAVFSPDGRSILSGGTGYANRNGQWMAIPPAVVVWDAATGKEVRRILGHQEAISSVTFSPDAQRIVSGSRDKSMRIWNAQTGATIRNLAVPDGYHDGLAAWSPDGKQILAGRAGGTSLHQWDADTGEQLREFVGLGGPSFHGVLFSPDGSRALTPGLTDIRIWDMTGREVRRLLRKDRKLIMANCAALSPDGKLLVTGEGINPGTARLWDVDPARDLQVEPGTERTEEVRRFEGNAGVVSAVAYSPTGRQILTGGGDQTVRLWNAETGKELLKIDAQLGRGDIHSVAFSPDGRTILAAGNAGICVWTLPAQ